MRSATTGFRLCGIAEEPFWPRPNGSCTSPTSVRARWRTSSAKESSDDATTASAANSSACRSRWRICGLARVVRAAALVGLENVAVWHERDISHSSAERVVIPDAFLALDYMLDRFAWLVEGLVVRPERMRRNLDASHGLFFSQRVLLALVESGLARDEAYRLVQQHAMRAWEEELDFRELCRTDDEIASRVDLDAASRTQGLLETADLRAASRAQP